MPEFLKGFFARLRSRQRGELGELSPIDRSAVETMLERSRIPAVLMLVLVWTVSAVLLMLSHDHQYQLQDWVEGQRAPYSIRAAVDFQYVDKVATDKKKSEARKRVPECCRLEDPARATAAVEAFFKRVDDKEAADKDKISKPLEKALREAYRTPERRREFREQLRIMLDRGVFAPEKAVSTVRIFGPAGEVYDAAVRHLTTPDECARKLADRLIPDAAEPLRLEFRTVLKKLIGERGNLLPDPGQTAAERTRAEDAVRDVTVDKQKGALLIRKGDIFTSAMRDMIAAERANIPGFGWIEAYRQMAYSFFILLAGVAFIWMISADIRRDNLRILLAGLTISAALALNYHAIKFAEYLQRNAVLHDHNLILTAVPVAFGAVVLAVVLDLRTALCAGGLVAVISAMMIMPYRSLELALRWTAISAGVVLTVRRVSNYRSFFVRTVLGVLVMTWALNLDVIFREHIRAELELVPVLREATWIVLANAVSCATLALLMIFVLELLFNLSTDMALMVLSDLSHPLLERMRREASGSMSHSVDVATLAEDAARAIGANPLRAKVGALFHDIGKLSNPQYFTENNPSSSLLHDKLTPQMSARIIRSHVSEGVALANRHRLCRFIRNVISTHHGDDLVRFFHHKAQEESKKTGVPVRDEQFRYSGTPPASREETIISLADACEAASRSLKDPTPETISALVGKIIQGRFSDGLLRNSRLTLAELDKLRKSFTATLTSMRHGRIAYPGGATSSEEDKKK